MNELPSQSSLDAAGSGAERIAELFYVMLLGAVLVWIIVIGTAVYATIRRGEHDARLVGRLVIGGGAIFPTIVLTALVTYGLALLPELHRPAPAGSPRIEVAGVRWWWRVAYRLDSGETVESANEIRLPLDQSVAFSLTSEDVIHSFWIPPLGGKMDMVPGRVNRLTLVPTKPGRYRGVCAEFCGAAHAEMAFDVVVMPRDEFHRWLEHQSQPATAPPDEFAQLGEEVFRTAGCGACHAIRGTSADGVVGPDLTHFGSRLSIGAGLLPNTPEHLASWIEQTHVVKPGVEMPAFTTLERRQLEALVAYLQQLE